MPFFIVREPVIAESSSEPTLIPESTSPLVIISDARVSSMVTVLVM